VLGVSERITVPNRATIVATGNNLRLRGDLPRRCYRIRLDAKSARPFQRSGFRHDPLQPWVREQRGALVAALLTLARAWHVAGRPPAPEARTLGSFETWVETIGGILALVGVEGFLGDLERLYAEADQEGAEWERFLALLHAAYGDRSFTASGVADGVSGDYEKSSLAEALPGDLADSIRSSPASFTKRLGKALSKQEGTRYGDAELHVVRTGEESRGGRVLWRVLTGSAGFQVSRFHGARHAGEPPHLEGVKGVGAQVERGTDKPATPANLRAVEDGGVS
jgi:hypothetical protein